MATKHVTLELTTEQQEVIKALFMHNGWEYIEVKSKKVSVAIKSSKQSQSQSIQNQSQGAPGYGDPDDDDDGDDGRRKDNGANDNQRCPMCFMQPCVTESQRHLGGAGQAASDFNPSIRKSIYRKFWSVINNLGGWQIDSYIAKKREDAQRHNIVYMKREIMPDCILTFVRELYPNPDGQPYMGHMWE